MFQLKFKTKNSTYRVQVSEVGQFHVTKLSEESHSPYNSVGQTRISDIMHLEEGYSAQFDSWHTSEVKVIYDVEWVRVKPKSQGG